METNFKTGDKVQLLDGRVGFVSMITIRSATNIKYEIEERTAKGKVTSTIGAIPEGRIKKYEAPKKTSK